MDQAWVDRLKKEMDAEAARTTPPEGFPQLPPIPAARYSDAAFFDLEREHVFSKSWVFAVHTGELPEPGHAVRFDRLGPPIVIVRGNDDVVRAFYNACQHRGAPVVRDASECAHRLVCKYHGWTYDLDGQLVGVPDERDFGALDRAALGLKPVRCETFGGLVFVCLDPDVAPLRACLGPLSDELAPFHTERLRVVDRHHFTLDCNWKAAIEANLEVYHLKRIHPHTVNQLLDHERTTIGLLPGGCSRMVSAKRDPANDAGLGAAGLPKIDSLTEISSATSLSYTVFPNLVTPTDVGGFPLLQFWPVDVRTTRFDVTWMVADWSTAEGDGAKGDAKGELPGYWKGFIGIFDTVLGEDTANLDWIQRSMESPGCTSVPLSYQERRLYYLHEEVDRRIGCDRVPAELHVPPMLGDWVERDFA